MAFNWASFGMNLAKGLTIGILGAEQMAQVAQQSGGNLSGTDKKNLAMDAIGIGATIASAVSSSNTDLINTVAQEASTIIDSLVNVFNLTGVFHHSSAQTQTPVQATGIVNPTK